MSNQYCAEVIESSLQAWQAQNWQWQKVLPFGALTVAQHGEGYIFGIVHQINTGSDDPQRVPYAYQKTEEELQREQPHIFNFLKTTCSCSIVGSLQQGRVMYQLADEPPRIHAFVGLATLEQQKVFFAQEYFVPLVYAAAVQLPYADELLFAVFKRALEQRVLMHDTLGHCLEVLSGLLGNDYRRFRLLLQRLEFIMHDVKKTA